MWGWVRVWAPTSHPADARVASSSHDIGTSSFSCGPPIQWSIPGHVIGASVPVKEVGTKTVPGTPRRDMIGCASSITER